MRRKAERGSTAKAKRYVRNHRKLKASLPDEKLKEQVDDAFNLQTELISLSDRDSFIDGFMLGVHIGVDVCSLYDLFNHG